MGDLDQLRQEMVTDLLRAWIDVYDRGEAIYQAYDTSTRHWVDEHGHRVESLVSVVATMQPDVRVLCRALVADALAAIESPLSQGAATVEDAVEHVIAQAKSGGEKMGGVGDVGAESVEARLARLEAMAEENAELIRRILERLDVAGSPPAPRAAP